DALLPLHQLVKPRLRAADADLGVFLVRVEHETVEELRGGRVPGQFVEIVRLAGIAAGGGSRGVLARLLFGRLAGSAVAERVGSELWIVGGGSLFLRGRAVGPDRQGRGGDAEKEQAGQQNGRSGLVHGLRSFEKGHARRLHKQRGADIQSSQRRSRGQDRLAGGVRISRGRAVS